MPSFLRQQQHKATLDLKNQYSRLDSSLSIAKTEPIACVFRQIGRESHHIRLERCDCWRPGRQNIVQRDHPRPDRSDRERRAKNLVNAGSATVHAGVALGNSKRRQSAMRIQYLRRNARRLDEFTVYQLDMRRTAIIPAKNDLSMPKDTNPQLGIQEDPQEGKMYHFRFHQAYKG